MLLLPLILDSMMKYYRIHHRTMMSIPMKLLPSVISMMLMTTTTTLPTWMVKTRQLHLLLLLKTIVQAQHLVASKTQPMSRSIDDTWWRSLE
jgi:hypothetical protein